MSLPPFSDHKQRLSVVQYDLQIVSILGRIKRGELLVRYEIIALPPSYFEYEEKDAKTVLIAMPEISRCIHGFAAVWVASMV